MAESDRTDNWDLWAIEPRPGAAPRQLTTDERSDNDPSWGSRPRLEPRPQVDRLRPGRPRQAHLLRPAPPRRGAGRRRPAADPDRRPDLNVLSPALHRRRRVDPLHARGRPGGRTWRRSRRRAGRSSASSRDAASSRILLDSPGGRVAIQLATPQSPRRDLRGREGRAAAPVEAERRLARRGQARSGRGDEVQEQGRNRDPRLPRQASGLPARNAATRRSSASTAGRSGQFECGFDDRVAVVRRQRLRRPRREPARQLRARREVPDRDLRRLGQRGRRGRARRRRRRGRARHRRTRTVSPSAAGATAAS